MTLGGPIVRNKVWFFGSYRRVQRDQTFNNAPVPVDNRGNLWFIKGTTQLDEQPAAAGERPVRQGDAGERRHPRLGRAGADDRFDHRPVSAARRCKSTNPSAFGTLVKGGPLASFNYNWVVSSNKVFQFVGSFMFNKPNDYVPNGSAGADPDQGHSEQPDGNILGSLTTIAQEGGFGAIDTSHRSMIYLSPSMTVVSNRLGSHEFRGGADLYPNIANETINDRGAGRVLLPSARHDRQPGCAVRARHPAQPRRHVVDDREQGVRASLRRLLPGSLEADVEDLHQGRRAGREQQIFTRGSRESAGRAAGVGRADQHRRIEEFHQWVTMPNFGIAYNAETLGRVSRHGESRLRVARPGRRRWHVARAVRAGDRRVPRQPAHECDAQSDACPAVFRWA